MNKQCTLCGQEEKIASFKGGFVCEDCLDLLRGLDAESVDLSPMEPVDSLSLILPVDANNTFESK